jgi:Anticodon binding domain
MSGLIYGIPHWQKEYASEVANRLSELGFYAEVDNGENTMPKKIRNGEIAQYNFILGKQDTSLRKFSVSYCIVISYSGRTRGTRCAVGKCAESRRCWDKGKDADDATRRVGAETTYAEEVEELAQQVRVNIDVQNYSVCYFQR